ncbi:MAG: TetR/AcrR family transcriptional regulator [Polyangiaceae bacterium]|nr:TetR/AcrR family transcriptional regulator [Polyangiaceae bacterium]
MASSKEDRRAQILGVARKEFARRGYHSTTIEDIVAAAGIARGTFYLYFADKRGVFEELVDRFSARLGMAILRVDPGDPVRSVADQVKENTRRVLSACLEDQMMSKIFMADTLGVDEAFDRKLLGFYDEVTKLFVESLTEGQALGLVRPGDPRLFAMFTMGGIREVLFQIVKRDGEYDLERLVDGLFAVFSSGFIIAEAASKRG